MHCKSCGQYLLFSAEMCMQCQKEIRTIGALKRHYSLQRLAGYDLRYAIIKLKKDKYTLKNIAFILDKDLEKITNAWEFILQDAT